MPAWLRRLLAALAEASEGFSPVDAPHGGVLPCQRVHPTVRLVCEGGGRFRAEGSPIRGDGVYRWYVSNGSAELSSTTGERVRVLRATPSTFDVEVCYGVDHEYSESAVRTVTVVPRLIHFIWAGGTRIMPREAMAVVCGWARANADAGFKVVLWVDLATREDVVAAYREAYEDLLAGLPVEFWDITAKGVVTAYARYEIDKLWPNYGSSSDLLRYAILARYGGAYFDSDVRPGAKPLIESRHFLSCEGRGFASLEQSQGHGIVGNDAFICAPGHAMMTSIRDVSIENYGRGLYNNAGRFDDFGMRLEATVGRTGPGAVLRALLRTGCFTPAGQNDEGFTFVEDLCPGDVITRRYRLGGYPPEFSMDPAIVAHGEGAANSNGWLKVPVKSLARDQAIEVAAASMRFEMEHMKMLRIVGTVREILVAIMNGGARAGREPQVLIATVDPLSEGARLIAHDLADQLGDASAFVAGIRAAAVANPDALEDECPYEEFAGLYHDCKD